MKRYTVIFSPLALNDIERACEYYNQQQKNLGKHFVKQVNAALRSVKANPFYARVRYEGIRCAVVNKFPFMVHYDVDETSRTVIVAAVYSTHQEPLWDK